MPAPLWKKKAAGRKVGAKRRYMKKKAPSTVPAPLAQSGMIPVRQIKRFKYSTYYNYGSGISQGLGIRINAPYDPDYQVGGHNLTGWSIASQMYKLQRTFKCRVTYDVVNTAAVPLRAAILSRPDATALAINDATFQQPSTYQAIVGNVAGVNHKRFSRTFYIPQVLGMTKTQFRADEDTASALNALPNTLATAWLAIQSIDPTSVLSTQVVVTVEYFVELFSPVVDTSF